STKSEHPPEVDHLQKQLAETQKLAERHKHRAVELEEREAARVVAEQALKKEVERLGEQIKQREQRELQLSAVVKPALLRIAELTSDLEQTRIKLAHVEAELSDLKKKL